MSDHNQAFPAPRMRVADVPSTTENHKRATGERFFFRTGEMRESERHIEGMSGIERLIWAPSRYCGKPRPSSLSQPFGADSRGILGELGRGDRND
jgi:hypothetical protein